MVQRISSAHPQWKRQDGACPACLQKALLQTMLESGDSSLHEAVQTLWPLDPLAAFSVLPTPLRMHADPRYSGRGVTMAFVDAGFYPHADLVQPHNRIRAWVDASREPLQELRFGSGKTPQWPGWDALHPSQWHGMMTSTSAAGNGWLSHGLYKGLAREADLVLVQVRDDSGHISSESIVRALRWLLENGPELGVRIASLSVSGDPVEDLTGNPVDEAVQRLTDAGVTVIAAAGNDGQRQLIPPATAPAALTIGGLDDHNTFNHEERAIWHSNYGLSDSGLPKPELVAPSIWVVAPVLPGTEVAIEAGKLFEARAAGNSDGNERIAELKLVTPHYQHVEGTSFAAPLVSSAVACMLEANPSLSPAQVRELLIAAAYPVPGAPQERQGAGALDAGQAVALALRALGGPLQGHRESPQISADGIFFLLLDRYAHQVQVVGSWDGWHAPGLRAEQVQPGVWQTQRPPLEPGRYAYKFILDGARWLDDPSNPRKVHNGIGGFDSLLLVPGP